MSNDEQKADALTALKERAQQLRNSAAILVKFVKGKWVTGETELNRAEFIARPDWLIHGWHRLWDGRVTGHVVGYVADGFVPPSRETLGDLDQDEWAIFCNKRDPWILQHSLPLYHPVSGAPYLWGTNTRGGEAAIGNLLKAYTERVDLAPEDGTTLPRILLNSDGYHHKEGFWVDTPQLDILGWENSPPTPRPPLPPPPPLPSALPPPAAAQAIEDSYRGLAF
jgi:hypothetical protein